MVLQDGSQTRDLILIMPDTANFSGRFLVSGCLIGDMKSSLQRLTDALSTGSYRGKLEAARVPSLRAPLGQDAAPDQDEFPILLAWDYYQSGHWREGKDKLQSMARYKPLAVMSEQYCHPYYIYEAINSRLGPKDTLCVDVGDQTLWASLLARLTKGTRTLSDEFMGTMGYSLPAAIAASLIQPEGVHVGVAGDGAFQMTLNELATAVQHNCRIIMVVFCNQSLGRVKFGFGGHEIAGTQITNPDYVALAKAYGADGMKVDKPSQASAAVDAAFKSKGVFVLEVSMDPTLRAEMAKMNDMHAVAAVASKLAGVLPESFIHLRRPQAMLVLVEVSVLVSCFRKPPKANGDASIFVCNGNFGTDHLLQIIE